MFREHRYHLFNPKAVLYMHPAVCLNILIIFGIKILLANVHNLILLFLLHMRELTVSGEASRIQATMHCRNLN